MIALEVLLLLGFQAMHGYVYQQLTIVIAGFMAGMALGSWLAIRRPLELGVSWLGVTQLGVTAAPLAMMALLTTGGAPGVIFPLAALAFGILGGFQFPLASRIFFAEEKDEGGGGGRGSHGLGTLYALDLAGSCLAALLLSTLFLPVYGFLKTALLTSMASLAPAMLAMLPAAQTGGRTKASVLQTPAP